MFPVTAPGKRRISRGNSLTTLLLPLKMHREYLGFESWCKKLETFDTFDEAVADDEDDTEEVDPFWSPLDAFSKGIVLEQTLIFMLPEYATEPKFLYVRKDPS